MLAASCPGSTSLIDSFDIEGKAWRVCEDLQVPDGALVLISADGDEEWFPKSYSMYGSANDEDPKFYLGLGKKNVTDSKMDLLGISMLSQHLDITWELVAGAVPVIKGTPSP